MAKQLTLSVNQYQTQTTKRKEGRLKLLQVKKMVSRHDHMGRTEFVRDEDTGDTHPEPTTSTSHTACDIPIDIAAGPDEAPVQPNMKFPTTLQGNRHRSFNSE